MNSVAGVVGCVVVVVFGSVVCEKKMIHLVLADLGVGESLCGLMLKELIRY